MKLFIFAFCNAAAIKAHDPEAMNFCQGKAEGFYENPRDCGSYFFCWNQGWFTLSPFFVLHEIREF